MCDPFYYQYAFAKPHCRVRDIGPGIDARFDVELIRQRAVAAVVSRVGPDRFEPDRLQGAAAKDAGWLGAVAARHNEIVCRASESSAVLPLRLGVLFRSKDSVLAILERCQATVVEFLRRFGDRQEWNANLYLKKFHLEAATNHAAVPQPHARDRLQTEACRAMGKPGACDVLRQLRVAARQTIQTVENRLIDQAEHCRRVSASPDDLLERGEDTVFSAAFLLPAAARNRWLETVEAVRREVQGKGMMLEVSGPWPPYHFCPSLELQADDE